MQIRLVPGDGDDYKKIVALRIRVLLNPIGISGSYIQPEKERDDLFVAAFDQEHLVGCCVLTPRTDEVVQLRQMAVDPVWQGKGIGAKLLSFAEDTAREKGFHILMMHARDPVIGFYSKSGYRITGAPFYEVGIGHHAMQKELR